ncbi:MAG: SusC/RagA family protein, partial [Bacteroidales bacterium]
DGKITKDDKTIIGNAMPKAFGGFNLNARFKGFDLSAAFSFVLGNDIYNANKIEFTNSSKYYNRNMLSMVEDRFTHIDWETGSRITDPEQLKAANTDARMWSPTMASNYFVHSWAIEDGSFLRLNTLTLGYSLPKQLLKKAYIQNCRFFFTGTNLFCLTNYSGFDPEVDTRRKTPMTPGVDYSAYPKSRGYNFGVNLTF